MKLYEEVNAIEDAINAILCSEEPDKEALDNLMQAKTDTIANGLEALCKIRARKQADIMALKEESNRLKERAEQEEKSLLRLQDYMLSMLQRSGQTKLSAGTFNVGTRTSTSVYVAPDFNNPKYMRTTTKVEPDKIAIKDALSAGESIDGANLVNKLNLSVK